MIDIVYRHNMDDRQWSIFMATVNLFAERGYHGTHIKDISEASGMSTDDIYAMYESKETLLNVIYDYYENCFLMDYPHVETFLSQVEDTHPHQLLENVISYHVVNMETEDIYNKIFLILAFQIYSDDAACELLMKSMDEKQTAAMRQVLRALVDRGKIEPLDIDAYLYIHSSIVTNSTLLTAMGKRLSWEKWISCQRMLIQSAIKPVRN